MTGDIVEKDVVLDISLFLRDYLVQSGARVVMTREEDEDFLQASVGPKKREDMRNRLQLMEEANPHILLSVHANDFSSSRWSGAQVFYGEGDESGKELGCAIQEELIRVLGNTNREARSAGYYLLQESSMPAVIVEVGFLSNPHEAQLLSQPEYQKKVAWAIYLGVVQYFSL